MTIVGRQGQVEGTGLPLGVLLGLVCEQMVEERDAKQPVLQCTKS